MTDMNITEQIVSEAHEAFWSAISGMVADLADEPTGDLTPETMAALTEAMRAAVRALLTSNGIDPDGPTVTDDAIAPAVELWLRAHEAECSGTPECACAARCAFCNVDHVPPTHDAPRSLGWAARCADCRAVVFAVLDADKRIACPLCGALLPCPECGAPLNDLGGCGCAAH